MAMACSFTSMPTLAGRSNKEASRRTKVRPPSVTVIQGQRRKVAAGAGLVEQVQEAAMSTLSQSSSQSHQHFVDLALGPQGPLVEEFWENVRRYALFFVTVVSGGLYSLVKPLVDLLRSPLTALLGLAIILGSSYLLYLTLSAMLGLTQSNYPL